jgi:PPOX class probable F420-dependent enzyme
VSAAGQPRGAGSVEAPAWAWTALATARVGRLATTDESGDPHVVPVCFVLAAGELWTAIDDKPKSTRALRRVKNLAAHPRAVLLVDHYEEDWRELRWVAVHGRGELVSGDAAAVGLGAMRAKYPQYAEIGVGPEAIRLLPERIVAWSADPARSRDA